MEKLSIDNKLMNNDNMIIPKANDDDINIPKINPFSFQLNLNINFRNEIYEIKEISNHRIGVVFDKYLLIYSSHTFKHIFSICPYVDLKVYENESKKDLNLSEEKFHSYIYKKYFIYGRCYKQDDYRLHNFVELRNKDLIIWSDNNIFCYKFSKKNKKSSYLIHQIINEFNQGTNSFSSGYDGTSEYYDLNSVNELMNGNLVSCNSFGLIFIKKKKTIII